MCLLYVVCVLLSFVFFYCVFFFFQAEDGIRDAQESRGLGDVYKRQRWQSPFPLTGIWRTDTRRCSGAFPGRPRAGKGCMLSLIHI